MNQLLQWLTGGDLRSDGSANEVADLVCTNPPLLNDLLLGLHQADDLVRARTTHALERISRSKPEMLANHLVELELIARSDQVPTVRWHIAMLLGNLAVLKKLAAPVGSTLLDMLADPSVFVKSWVISSLCIVGRKYPAQREQIIQGLVPLLKNHSPAVRSRASKATQLLLNDSLPMPAGWVKSNRLKNV
jgi:HEAT repeat protein